MPNLSLQESLSKKSLALLQALKNENPRLNHILMQSQTIKSFKMGLREWAQEILRENPIALQYQSGAKTGQKTFHMLRWQDVAAIRVIDYIDNAGRKFVNPYQNSQETVTDPFKLLWLSAKKGSGGAKPLFFEDMLYLFRQLSLQFQRFEPTKQQVTNWMNRWNHGLEPDIIREREKNRDRIIRILADHIDSCGSESDSKYLFEDNLSHQQKIDKVREWWNDHRFQLRYAVREPKLLNEMLNYSLDEEKLKLLERAKEKGIPFFINPYYLSLLNTYTPNSAVRADLAIRHYVIYSKPLIDQFGNIKAWEKEDRVENGKPNTAGWLLPSKKSVHRRYPEVAILIPRTMGRACGGLCASCQRMYDFQRGNLNFNLEKLKPNETWDDKLQELLEYWENDAQLRDILITGGDALMSQDKSLENILDRLYEMAYRKREANRHRPVGEKYAEIVRIRLGTRLPAYLPMRITPNLVSILKKFREKSLKIGIKQFIIQTHFESPMEVTPEAQKAIGMLLEANWIVTNQLVFTTATSRRGHTAQLRKVLNDIGVIPYYTFSVKGFLENMFNYATNSRALQEQIEEKSIGKIPAELARGIDGLSVEPNLLVDNIKRIRKMANIPFLATDRSVMNLPGVGKSLTFRTIGITRWGRRILEFDYDHTRWHSPIIDNKGKFVMIESKPIGAYMRQIAELGENIQEYESLWGYSIGETEGQQPIFGYPKNGLGVTQELTNFKGKTE